MPRTDHTPTTARPDAATSRRALLAGAGALFPVAAVAIAPALAAPATSPDAALIIDCSAFDTLERRYQVLCNEVAESPARQALLEAIEGQRAPLLTRICAARATTLAGARAKASTLMLWEAGDQEWGCDPEDENEYTNYRLLASLMRDLAGELEMLRSGPVAPLPAAVDEVPV